MAALWPGNVTASEATAVIGWTSPSTTTRTVAASGAHTA